MSYRYQAIKQFICTNSRLVFIGCKNKGHFCFAIKLTY